MIPAAPASSARPIRSRSADWGRTIAVVRSPMAWSWAISSDSVPAPCSRSTISQSKPARARSSAWIAEPPLTNDPKSVSPARMRPGASLRAVAGAARFTSVDLGSGRHHDGSERVMGRIERSGTSAHL
jgi:hypothetical protein